MPTMGLIADAVVLAAPWFSAALAIGAAAAAERSFRMATAAQPPERWRGDDVFHTGIDIDEEIDDRSRRDVSGIDAAAMQSIATYLAAAAAIEAAAASQHGLPAIGVSALGISFAGALSVRRWLIAFRDIAYGRAWFIRMKWAMPRKYIHLKDPTAEDAAFAEDHPVEARALLRGRGR